MPKQRPRVGSKKTTLVVYVRLPPDIVERLDAQVQEEERDRSAIVRRALAAYCTQVAA